MVSAEHLLRKQVAKRACKKLSIMQNFVSYSDTL